MDYVIVLAAAYWIYLTLREFVEAPEWIWYLLLAVGGSLGMFAITSGNWWWGLGTPAFVILITRLDDLLLSLGDAARVSVLRNTNRR